MCVQFSRPRCVAPSYLTLGLTQWFTLTTSYLLLQALPRSHIWPYPISYYSRIARSTFLFTLVKKKTALGRLTFILDSPKIERNRRKSTPTDRRYSSKWRTIALASFFAIAGSIGFQQVVVRAIGLVPNRAADYWRFRIFWICLLIFSPHGADSPCQMYTQTHRKVNWSRVKNIDQSNKSKFLWIPRNQ